MMLTANIYIAVEAESYIPLVKLEEQLCILVQYYCIQPPTRSSGVNTNDRLDIDFPR